MYEVYKPFGFKRMT